MSREGALWIGGLETYMDEDFIMKAMQQSGEDTVLSVKVIKNKFTGGIAGYGFVNFPNDNIALKAMHRLNGKMIPNSRPPARYKLNHNSNRILPGEKNHSIWVGDLSPEVDDLGLYNFFSARFTTIISAKVVLDESGTSKGFGFIRFGNETEQQTALTAMQGVSGLGMKQIKVSIAVQKSKESHGGDYPPHFTKQLQQQMTGHGPQGYGMGGGDYNAYYNQYNNYWSNMAAWQQYNNYYQQYPPQDENMMNPPLPPNPAHQHHQQQHQQQQHQGGGGNDQNQQNSQQPKRIKLDDMVEESILDGPLNQPVEHSKAIDYQKLNRQYLSRSEELYSSIEQSGWL